MLAIGFTTACGASTRSADPARDNRKLAIRSTGEKVTNERAPINQQFRNLDEYLAHLERQSHMDGKWYKEIRPGVYELQTGNLRLDAPGNEKRIFTRDELATKFGFAN